MEMARSNPAGPSFAIAAGDGARIVAYSGGTDSAYLAWRTRAWRERDLPLPPTPPHSGIA